jgi:hypothetical protein
VSLVGYARILLAFIQCQTYFPVVMSTMLGTLLVGYLRVYARTRFSAASRVRCFDIYGCLVWEKRGTLMP